MDDTPFFNTEGMSPRGGIFNSASKTAYAKEKEQKDDSDSKSVVSTDSPADKEKGDQIPTRKDKPFDAQSVASAKTHTEGMGLRKRGNKVSQSEENLLETHAVQRAETTPDLLSAKKPSSLRMFASRPTSPRKDIGSITEQSPSLDESSSLNSSTELPKQVHTTSVSIDENKSPERPASVASFDSDGQPTNKLTPQSVLTAVRSRDKTALQSQVSVGREAVKKWGVDFMNKRREHRQEREQRIAQQQEQSSPPSYYAPSAEDDLSSSQPRSSFQERLNAAALAAAAKLESERKAAAANQGTPPQLPNRPSPPQLPNRPTPPQLPSRNTKPRSDSSGSSTLSPARPMVVPSVPKRPGIPTAIGNDASKAKSELAVPALSGGASGGGEEIESLAPPPQITRGDSDPLAATVNDRVDDIGETDKAAAPVPSVTAANVTARTRQASNGSNSSPARESLLAAAAQSPPIVPGSEKQ